jgi:hypothetical protein
VSTPTQAFLELAAVGVGLVDLVVAGDSLVKATALTPEAFVAAAEAWTGNGARRARDAARLVREGVDSPPETRLRLLVVLAGLPEPRVNLILRHENGDWRWRFDLAFEELKLILEYDGRQHAYDDKQWSHDLGRREALDRLGWRMLVVVKADLYDHPEKTLQRIRRSMIERGAKGLPRRLSSNWTRYFPTGG